MDVVDEIIMAEDRLRQISFRCMFGDIKRCGIHPGQMPILHYIELNEGCTQSDVAKSLGTSPATVAVSVRRLLAAGLIDKSADSKDMRLARLGLTELGRSTTSAAVDKRRQLSETQMSDFSAEERVEYLEYVRRLARNLNNRFYGEERD